MNMIKFQEDDLTAFGQAYNHLESLISEDIVVVILMGEKFVGRIIQTGFFVVIELNSVNSIPWDHYLHSQMQISKECSTRKEAIDLAKSVPHFPSIENLFLSGFKLWI